MAYDYDLFTIGGGSGGVRACRRAAIYGARVGLAEASALGGTCVNLGCVPKKLFWYAAHAGEGIRQARSYGWTVDEPGFDWPTLRAAKDRYIAYLNGIYRRLLERPGVDIHEGWARLVDPHTVAVGERRISAEHILIATGGAPRRPRIPGAEHVLVSDDLFHLEKLPRRLLVVGGGYIAVEMASILFGLGVETELCYRGSLFLRGFDDGARLHLAQVLRDRGLQLHFDCDVASIERSPDGGLRAALTDDRVIETDAVLYAIGRKPRTEGIGLEQLGVALDKNGKVVVDELSRTNVPSLWAIGDVTDRPELTPVAIHEGDCLARTLFAGAPTAPSWDPLATAVFSQPPLGTVGLTEEAARARHSDVDCYSSTFRPLQLGLTDERERSYVKVIVEAATDRVLGLHMVGPDAPEIVQGFAAALQAGLTKRQLDATLAIHPTSAEELVTLPEPMRESATVSVRQRPA